MTRGTVYIVTCRLKSHRENDNTQQRLAYKMTTPQRLAYESNQDRTQARFDITNCLTY